MMCVADARRGVVEEADRIRDLDDMVPRELSFSLHGERSQH